MATIDVRRSLVVTEKAILARFSFQRVMEQLASQSEVPGLTAVQLFRQWWDTQNPAPGLGVGEHCDDLVDGLGNAILNGYPYACRPSSSNQEGAEAFSDPFAAPGTNLGEYIAVGLFNRFDLAPANGAHCGEHRIVYARRSGIPPPGVDPLDFTNPANLETALNRNLIIFEAVLPNPAPSQGLKGCDKIVKLWAGLTSEKSVEKRAASLETFYFQGLAGVPPVVHRAHYGDNPAGAGQVRTNQFMQENVTPRVWNLREFKLLRTCAAGACSAMRMVPVTNKTNPFGPLFAPGGTHPGTAAFQEAFAAEVATLAADTLGRIDMRVADVFNTGQSLASGSTENNYVAQLTTGPSPLRDRIQGALDAIGSTLTPDHIVARAQALSCAGCHQLNANPAAIPNPPIPDLGGGLVWPRSLGFTHVTERLTEPGDGSERFVISPALLNEFLPARRQVMERFLEDKPFNTRRPDDPIGGRRTH